jgi:recombination protein RecR
MVRSVEELVALIAEMPGVGPRQARRIVQFLLRKNKSYAAKLAGAIEAVHDHVRQCVRCFRYDEINKENACSLCADKNRDESMLMVVEKDVDIEGIEQVGMYRGHYFVLGALMPLATQRKAAVEPRTKEFVARARAENAPSEIILAFATTPEGDFTAQELKTMCKEKAPNIRMSMLGRGLSLGAEIEYADQETLRNAFIGRS